MQKFSKLFTAFVKDEDGVALTEYLILLGLVCAAVVVAVGLFGEEIAVVFDGWTDYLNNTINAPG